MDPNQNKFPILSYVMSRVSHLRSKSIADSEWQTIDLEQPPPSDGASTSTSTDLANHMPHLNNPDVLQSMALAVSHVAQTRSVINKLGDRPDHESVDTARSKITHIESQLSKKLEEIELDRCPEDVDPVKWRAKMEEKETECKKEAEKEMEIYKAVVRLDEMHQAYEKLLKEAEDKLVWIYASVEEKVVEEEVNEEIVAILQSGQDAQQLDLAGRYLRILPEEFWKLKRLLSLNLSHNLFQTIPDSIAGLEILEQLNLSTNCLESLPDSIGLLLNLKILDVSSNKLKNLPDTISHCKSLVELDVSFNSLMYLPTNIGYELLSLKILSVHYNKIRSLPSSICEMTALSILDARFNELHILPRAIGRLTNLEILNLSSNFSDLTELPGTIGDLTSLKEIDISNNQIHALPVTFGRLENLTKLNLEQNPIVVPPIDIVNRGVEAVKEFMTKRWLDIIVEEEERSKLEAKNNQAQTGGWLTRSTSLLNNWASVVSGSVTGYLGGGDKSPHDPYLDQQL